MHIEQFNIKDPWVQEFLWKHLVPADIRYDYTKLDAMNLVAQQVRDGDCVLVGCRESGVMFRCVARNPLVLEPHVMGNAMRMRSVTKAAIPTAWELGYERITVWTQYPAIVAAMESIGFKHEACVPRCHLQDGKLLDTYALSIEKGDWHE